MDNPRWISKAEVQRIYDKIIEATGGSYGLRDASLLESAIARPQHLHSYGEKDVFQLAASYAEGLAGNHAFVDGNKRIAYQVADIFLYKNGHELLPSKGDEHADMIVDMVENKINRDDVAQHFKDNCRAIEKEKSTEQAKRSKKDWAKKSDRKTSIKKAPPIKRDLDRSR